MKAALEDGANVDEHPRLPYAPIVAATIASRADMVSFLLEQGADPDRPVTKEVEVPCVIGATTPGERALHIAARSGNVDIVRLLLKRSRADPNATDNDGYTPLLATCASPYVSVEVVPLLLEAGADPALADEKGFIPLHTVATKGFMDLVDVLHSTRSNTLNRRAAKGETPLFVACGGGHESMVSKLLSLAAMQPTPLAESPLTLAVMTGSVGVIRVLVNEGGIRAIGGDARWRRRCT
ncbi:unnamed protein product [Laminaria digitata]